MGKIPGAISITGLLAPNDSADTYAITDEKYNRGGYRAVSTPTERDNITQDRRSEGMLVKVLSENKFYTLSGGVWVEQVMGGTGGGGGATVTGVLPISVTNNAVSILKATTTEAGAMSAADKLKLNGIASGAEVNVNADWNAVSGDAQILNKPSTFTPSAHNHSAAEITSGTIETARLGSGTASNTTFLRGDNTWQTVQTNTPTATSSILGGIKLWSDTVQSVDANSVSFAASRTYGIQFNGSNQAVVNVPWTDTDTNTTYTFASGTTNGAFQVTPSGSSAISVSIYGLGSAAYTASTAYAASNHTHDYSSTYQPIDADLTAISALSGTSGLLKKTASNTWALDTSTYVTGSPWTSSDTSGKSGSTDAIKSATTTINVSSAAAPTSGQVLTATSSTSATWQTLPAGGVTSVNTKTGNVVLSKSDLSLGNVDNTSDLSKPISTLTQTELDKKQTVFTGICQIQYLTENDIYVNATDNTVVVGGVNVPATSIAILTVKNGTAITAQNPICFYTDGDGTATKWTKTSPVIFDFSSIAGTSGVKYFYFDSSGNPISSNTPWSDFSSIAAVYRLYWNVLLSGADRNVIESVEYHKNDISWADHAWKHNEGARWISGFDITHAAISTGTPLNTGANTCVALSSGKNVDDNLFYSVTNSTSASKFTQDLGTAATIAGGAKFICTYNNNSTDLRKTSGADISRFPFLFNQSTNVPQYITTSGTRTDVPSGNFFVYYIYALQDPRSGEAIKMRSAEVSFTTLTLAQAHSWEQLQSVYPTLKDGEIRLLYKLTFQTIQSGGQAYPIEVKYSALRQVDDLRKQRTTTTATAAGSIPATSVVVTPTGSLNSSNAQSALEELQTEITTASIKEMVISKSTFNSIAEPGIYKNGATAKQITGYRLTSNATDFQFTIGGTSYTKDSIYPITLGSNTEMIINDVTIANTYNIGNVILIIT